MTRFQQAHLTLLLDIVAMGIAILQTRPLHKATVLPAPIKPSGHPGPVLLAGSGKSIKEQLQELRKQYAK
jgi:hypothetical protein